MSRTRKLFIVAIVLAIGITLSLPFRKTTPHKSPVKQDTVANTTQPVGSQNFHQQTSDARPSAKMTSAGNREYDTNGVTPTTSFDLANHPAMSNQTPAIRSKPVTPTPRTTPPQRTFAPQSIEPQPRPAYQTVERSTDSESAWPREVVHVVQDGDTLENLAKRYLGDKERALEIFDMNRDKLTNPHQLPIDAELRVPVAPGRMLD